MVTPDPRKHLIAAARRRRHVWREFDRVRAARGQDLPTWPDWCYCPLAASYAVVSGGSNRQLTLEEAGEISQLGALAAWRATQGIYRFDPDLMAELVAGPIGGDIPTDVLYRLPEWCVYVEAVDLKPYLQGFFAHLEWDANSERSELRLLLDFGDRLVGVPIHLGGTLAKGLERADREASAQFALRTDRAVPSTLFGISQNASHLTPLVNLVLYLCSTEPDFGDVLIRLPREVRGRYGPKINPPSRPLVHKTGYRIGSALRKAAAQRREQGGGIGTGKSPIPHVRRAHWHTYRVGPRDKQRRELRWISPILVGATSADDIDPVVRPVVE